MASAKSRYDRCVLVDGTGISALRAATFAGRLVQRLLAACDICDKARLCRGPGRGDGEGPAAAQAPAGQGRVGTYVAAVHRSDGVIHVVSPSTRQALSNC